MSGPPTCILASLLILALGAALGEANAGERVPFKVPADSTIPGGPEGEAIKFGRALVTDTRKMLPRNVGNALNCTSCHLEAGTTPSSGPFVGIWGLYPEYRSRDGRIDSLQERVNDCFRRSMNGRPLAFDSAEMNAILLYIRWLSTGVPTGTEAVGREMGEIDTALKPDPVHGRQIYAGKCAGCHGAAGDGTRNHAGEYAFPPVWGKASFNVGAGMARTYVAAAFIKHNMPLGEGNSLSDQEAVDVAEFMTHQPRPAYPLGKNDYPKGDKPKDARN